jgi:hypothetical protein
MKEDEPIPVLCREPRVESVVAAGRGVHIRGVLPILATMFKITSLLYIQ